MRHGNRFGFPIPRPEHVGTSASLLVASALLVVTRKLVETSATLLVTGALLVVTRKLLLSLSMRPPSLRLLENTAKDMAEVSLKSRY